MFKEKFESIKALFTKKTEGNNKRSKAFGDFTKLVTEEGQGASSRNKKNIESLVVFLIILIITIIAINVIWKENKKETPEQQIVGYKELAAVDESATTSSTGKSEDGLEQRLENILTNITGVRGSKGTNYIF